MTAHDPTVQPRTGPVPPSTWRPVDIDDVLAGNVEQPQPTVGHRQDGAGVLYPGRQHSVAGESEALKTWFALHLARQELTAGNAVCVLDFEDDEHSVTRRLLDLGATPDQLSDRFLYVRPEEPLTDRHRGTLADALTDVVPTLVVLDGVTEAMTLHGLNPLDNADVAKFGRLLPRSIADLTGAAILSLDHVTKASESRGRYAIGAAHKLNGLNGAAYVLDNRAAFGAGLTGRSTVTLVKDRPGQLRGHALPSSTGHWYADLVLESHPEGFIDSALHAPIHRDEDFTPTTLMQKVSDALAGAPEPLTQREIEARVTGNASAKRTAIARLVDAGHITRTDGPGRSKLHTLVRPYGDTP